MVVFVIADCLVGNGGGVVGSFVSIIVVGGVTSKIEVFLTFQR